MAQKNRSGPLQGRAAGLNKLQGKAALKDWTTTMFSRGRTTTNHKRSCTTTVHKGSRSTLVQQSSREPHHIVLKGSQEGHKRRAKPPHKAQQQTLQQKEGRSNKGSLKGVVPQHNISQKGAAAIPTKTFNSRKRGEPQQRRRDPLTLEA